ncbi:MAG: tape measure protein [Bacteroidales bacterium]|nr:tape measure protein [Bacteroidales bacterium]
MSKMNFAIALRMTTDQFKRGADAVKKGLLSIQYQALGMASALGLGGIGLKNMVSRFIDVARETTKARVALKNISGDAANYSKNLQFLTKLSGKYGQEINGMTSEFSKFSAAATSAGISLSDQHEIFSLFTRSITAFGMSSEDAKFSYMALSQMMSKGRVSSEELRRQLGERMPIAMEAMARAVGVTIQELDDLLKKGAILSKDVMLPFVREMQKMMPNVDVDNIETSLSRLSNIFTRLTEKFNIAGIYKKIIDGAASMLETLQGSFARVITTIATTLVGGKLLGAFRRLTEETKKQNEAILAEKIRTEQQVQLLTQKRVAAEKKYNDTLVLYNNASNEEKLRSYSKLTAAESALDRARQREKAGTLAMNKAAEKAAAIQTQTVWTTAWTKIGAFVKGIVVSIRGLFSTLIPMAVIGILTDFIMKIVEARKEAKEISNIFSEYKNKINDSGTTEEIEKLKTLHRIVTYRLGTEEQVNAAQKQLLGLLGIEEGKQVDINKKVAERVKMLEAAARMDAAIQAKLDAEDKIKELGRKYGKGDSILEAAASVRGGIKTGWSFGKEPQAVTDYKRLQQYVKVWLDSQKTIDKYAPQSISTTRPTTTGGGGGGSTGTNLTALQKAEQQYRDELVKISNLYAAGVATKDETNKATDELNRAIYAEIGSILGAKSTLNETFLKAKQGVENPLYRESMETATLPIEGMRDATFDYKKDSLQQLEELREIKAEYINALKGISEDEFLGISEIIDAESQNLNNIDAKINAGRIKKDIQDISKELKSGMFTGLEDIYGLAKNIGNAFLNIRDTFADADATFFEQLISVFDALFSTINGVMSVMETIENVRALTERLGDAKKAESIAEIGAIGAVSAAKVAADTAEIASATAKTTAIVAGLTAQEVAAKGVMAAQSTAAYAYIPFAGPALAAGQIATMQGLISAAKIASAIPGFTDGGFVPGSSFTGDNVLARVNSGELILNKSQQANLWKAAHGKFSPAAQRGSLQNLRFEIEGKNLVAIFDQYATRKKRH